MGLREGAATGASGRELERWPRFSVNRLLGSSPARATETPPPPEQLLGRSVGLVCPWLLFRVVGESEGRS